MSVEVVRKPPKPVPEEVAKVWAQEEWAKERGQGGGLAEVDATQRFPGLAEEVGGGAHLRLDLSQSQDEQGL